MNKTRIRGVAMALLTNELAMKGIGYNQSVFRVENGADHDYGGHNCQTVACIAGTATALYKPRIKRNHWEQARKLFGISKAVAEQLFTGNVAIVDPTAKQAAVVLLNLADTGKVEWLKARRS